ncbi:uncharacterized protein [Onthophagus taurus]|uniref:uncharacterized protein n=1 Tax=Onthophagus taurus TaxID=166361 RepID=UPI0039BDAC49
MDIEEQSDNPNMYNNVISDVERPLSPTQRNIETSLLEVEIERTFSPRFELDGRRIVDVSSFMKQICEIGYHNPFNCSVVDMHIISEQRNGLSSQITLQCKMCGIQKKITTDSINTSKINDSVVLAATSIGIGYSQADEFFSVLDIPFMANKTYNNSQDNIAHIIHDSALKSMEEAAKEEAEIAKNIGDVNKNGIPCITVVVDGAWSKRSYNVNYNALSGVACIIGQRTGKLLYLNIRNKYCCICARAEHNESYKTDHICYKNWNGSSTAMKSDIIVEGFKCSIEMHGLKYTKIVGDGDSSVYKKILETRPYGSACIEKIECRNHLDRNLGTKLREISRRKKSLSTNCCVPISIRKHIMTSTQRLCIAIKKATQYRATETNDLADKIKLLKHDILNCPSHIFGEHKDCVAINYFNCSPKDSEVNYVPEMKACGVYEDILACLHRITYNASSLLHNMNTNDAEHYNAVVCKFIGGKRVNFSLKNSYSIRCKAAALSFNEKSNYYNIIQKALTSKDPRSILKKIIARRHRKK